MHDDIEMLTAMACLSPYPAIRDRAKALLEAIRAVDAQDNTQPLPMPGP